MIQSDLKAQERKRGDDGRNLTTHSTEARVSVLFIREDWMFGSLCARSVNSGVRHASRKQDS
jgi:hypothetical protein